MKLKTRRIILIVTLLLMGSGYALSQEPSGTMKSGDAVSGDSLEKAKADSAAVKDAPARKLIAYYFYTTRRCASCRKIEAYSGEAIKTAFADQLKSGRVEWRPLNTDDPVNSHFIEDYQLYTKSLILADLESGQQVRWKNLQKVWELLNDKQAFIEYVQSEINGFLGEN